MSNCTGVRTVPASGQRMSKESSPASQSKPIPASETEETVTPVSHTISLTELTTSLEALNAEVDKRLTIVHHTQTSSSLGANKIPGSPDTWDQKKTSPALAHWPRRYALQMWLEIEVGPGLFAPQKMTLIQSTLLWRLLIELIRVVQECTWIELATCWPFMAKKAVQELASFRMLQLRPAKQ